MTVKEARFKSEALGSVMISFSTEGAMPDRIWTDFVAQLKNPNIAKYIATSIGATAMTSIQRKLVSDVLNARRIPVMVITDSSLSRGMVTAVSWLGVNIKSFDWPDMRKGLTYLNITGVEQDRAVEALVRLRSTSAR